MGSIQVRKETGRLILDFYYRGTRCREQSALADTEANRKLVQKMLDRIEDDIRRGIFDYARYFPSSRNAQKFAAAPLETAGKALQAAIAGTPYPPPIASSRPMPLLRDFAETWFAEKSVEWRKSHKIIIRADLDNLIIPRFGEKEVGQVTKADVLAFRADLAKLQARGKETMLSNRRINKILMPLRMILNEAADRYDFRTPFQHIKPLKQRKGDVNPFSLDEVKQILETVRADFRDYLTVRFFTGMRTGEIDGLKWQYVDFERRLILVRETVVAGEEEYTKTDGSQRDIQMSQLVHDALKHQEQATRHLSKYVFCNRAGKPLEHRNVTNRVWYPLLRHLGLKERRPYQTRHTAATLWLAAGESPEWIARQMGHTTTEMLFKVYSRYVPNLTRQDGSAFERLLAARMGKATPTAAHEPVSNQSVADNFKESA